MIYSQQFTMKKGIASHHQGSVTLQKLSETLEVKGILLWNHPSLFAVGVRNSGRKGDLLGITLYYLQQVSETQAGKGIFLGITLHCLQPVSETQTGRGICFGITLHCLQPVSETQTGRGICFGITLHCLQPVSETQAGRGIC